MPFSNFRNLCTTRIIFIKVTEIVPVVNPILFSNCAFVGYDLLSVIILIYSNKYILYFISFFLQMKSIQRMDMLYIT